MKIHFSVLLLILFSFASSRIQESVPERRGERVPIRGSQIGEGPTPISSVRNIQMTYEQFKTKYQNTLVFRYLRQKNLYVEVFRRSVFQKNLQILNRHNLDPRRTYNVQVREHLILTERQFSRLFLSLKLHEPLLEPSSSFQQSGVFTNTMIKSYRCFSGSARQQGLCGGCYAFATTDTVSITEAIYTQSLFSMYYQLSPQQIISSNFSSGCQGGTLPLSFSYMQKYGINYEWNYPYTNLISQITHPPKSVPGNRQKVSKNKFQNYKRIPYGDCEGLLFALKTKPIAVGIHMTFISIFITGAGTYSSTNPNPNHGVVLVSYNYNWGYQIKNSWGIWWGSYGYHWVSKFSNAGICNYAVTMNMNSESNPQDQCN